MRTPHDPQMAARHEQRIAIERVLAVLDLEDAVEDGALGRQLDVVVGPVGGLTRLGVEAADLQGEVGQYVLSCGSHWVMVTSE